MNIENELTQDSQEVIAVDAVEEVQPEPVKQPIKISFDDEICKSSIYHELLVQFAERLNNYFAEHLDFEVYEHPLYIICFDDRLTSEVELHPGIRIKFYKTHMYSDKFFRGKYIIGVFYDSISGSKVPSTIQLYFTKKYKAFPFVLSDIQQS